MEAGKLKWGVLKWEMVCRKKAQKTQKGLVD
jgi:hypothetical protein